MQSLPQSAYALSADGTGQDLPAPIFGALLPEVLNGISAVG